MSRRGDLFSPSLTFHETRIFRLLHYWIYYFYVPSNCRAGSGDKGDEKDEIKAQGEHVWCGLGKLIHRRIARQSVDDAKLVFICRMH